MATRWTFIEVLLVGGGRDLKQTVLLQSCGGASDLVGQCVASDVGGLFRMTHPAGGALGHS